MSALPAVDDDRSAVAAAAQATAERVRDAMYAKDRAARALGIEVPAIAPGSEAVAPAFVR